MYLKTGKRNGNLRFLFLFLLYKKGWHTVKNKFYTGKFVLALKFAC